MMKNNNKRYKRRGNVLKQYASKKKELRLQENGKKKISSHAIKINGIDVFGENVKKKRNKCANYTNYVDMSSATNLTIPQRIRDEFILISKPISKIKGETKQWGVHGFTKNLTPITIGYGDGSSIISENLTTRGQHHMIEIVKQTRKYKFRFSCTKQTIISKAKNNKLNWNSLQTFGKPHNLSNIAKTSGNVVNQIRVKFIFVDFNFCTYHKFSIDTWAFSRNTVMFTND